MFLEYPETDLNDWWYFTVTGVDSEGIWMLEGVYPEIFTPDAYVPFSQLNLIRNDPKYQFTYIMNITLPAGYYEH